MFKAYSTARMVNGGWLHVSGTGAPWGDQATRIGIHDTDNTGGVSGWWLSQNQDGKFAIHQNGVGDRLTIDGNVTRVQRLIRGATYGFGGMYEIGEANVHGPYTGPGAVRQPAYCEGKNVYTGACSCPDGFFPASFTRDCIREPDNQWDQYFYCAR